MSNECIADGLVVGLHYTLSDGDGNEIETTQGDEPLEYLHGCGNIVPGLEQQLTGKAIGEQFEAVVEPAEAYGEKHEQAAQRVPRSEFPEEIPLEAGMHFAVENSAGEMIPIWILEVTDDDVLITLDHPLAGVRLHFDISVVSLREATEEEKAHGHVHGAGCEHEH